MGWFNKKEKSPEDIQTKSIQVLFHDSPFFSSALSCNSALQGYKNKTVYAVANVLVNKLLEVPILVAKESNTKRAKYFTSGKSLNPEQLLASKRLGIEEQTDHELNDLLSDTPNDYQTGAELRRAFWFNKTLTGAGILWVERRGSGLSRKSGIKAIHCLPTYMVRVEKSDNWKSPVVKYYFSYNGIEFPLRKEDVLYSGNWNPKDMIIGYDPFDTVGSTVLKNNINEMAQLAAFKNGGTGILFSSDTVTDGVGGVSDKMSAENMAALKETISREYAGAANNKKMHFTNGFVTVTSYGDTLADLKLIEASADEVKGICSVFGVSPILIGEGQANTESNVVQAYKSLVTNTIVPKLREFDQAFNKFSKDWYGADRVKIYHDITEFAELMANMELVMKIYGNNPAITLNELRIILGMDTKNDPLYDKSYIQSGFVPLEDAGFTNAYSGTGQGGANG